MLLTYLLAPAVIKSSSSETRFKYSLICLSPDHAVLLKGSDHGWHRRILKYCAECLWAVPVCGLLPEARWVESDDWFYGRER